MKPGSKVTLQAGDNLAVKQEGGKVTYSLKKDITLDSVKTGDTVMNKDGITISNGTAGKSVSLTKDGLNNGGNKITNVAAGTEDNDAVNVKQLKTEIGNVTGSITNLTETVDKGLNFGGNSGDVVNKKLGDTVKIIGEGTKADDQYDGQNVKTMTDANGNLVIKLDKNMVTESVKTNEITVGGKGADGAAGKDGIVAVKGADGKDGVTINGKDGTIGMNGKDGASATLGVKEGRSGVDGKAGETMTRIEYKDKDGKSHEVATLDDGMKYTGDKGSAAVKLNNVTNIVGGNKGDLSDGNIGVVAEQDGDNAKLTVKLAKDIKGLSSVESETFKSGDTVVNSSGMTINNGSAGKSVSLTKDGLNNGGNRITNVAPGVNGTDAVNVNQLGEVNNRVTEVAQDVQHIGAQAAALSALQSIQYDPLEPTQIMAGYGYYDGTSAWALGVAHYENESTMFHGGLSWAGSNSHLMIHAGITWKFGKSNAEQSVNDRYRKGPISASYALQHEMSAIKEENKGLKNQVVALQAENEEIKASLAQMKAKLGL